MSNQPAEVRIGEIFRDNVFEQQIQFLPPAVIVAPVVIEIKRRGDLIISVPGTINGNYISYTLSVELLNSLLLYQNYDLYVKMGSDYVLWSPITITTDGAVSSPRSTTVTLPSIGTIKVSTYSDLASVQQAEAAAAQAKSYRDEALQASRPYLAMGDWNATTNTPTLSSTAPGADSEGRYREYIITNPGPMPFAISNLASGANIGYGTLKAKSGGVWFYDAQSSAALDKVTQLENSFVPGENLFDASTMVEAGSVTTAGNVIATAGSFRGKMKVLPNTTYSIFNRIANLNIRFGNAADGKVGQYIHSGSVDSVATFTTPVLTDSMRFSLADTEQAGLDLSLVQVRLGNATDLTLHPFYRKMDKLASKVVDYATIENAGADGKSIANIDSIRDYLIDNKYRKMDGTIEYSVNLADPKYITEDMWIHNTNGRIVHQKGYRALRIPVTPEQTYRLSGRGWNTTLSFFDKFTPDRVLIGQQAAASNFIQFTVPAGANWMFTSIDNSEAAWGSTNGTLLLTQGETVYSYEPAGIKSFTLTHIEGTPINFEVSAEKKIGLAERSLVGVWSNSYAAGYPSLPGKDFINVISQFTDWGFYNYGQDGDDVSEILTRVRANTARWLAGVSPSSYTGGGYILIMDVTNSSGAGLLTAGYETYLTHIKNLCEIALAYGYQPIIASEWKNSNGSEFLYSAMSEFAYRNNIMFADAFDTARFLTGTKPAKYYHLDHPGVRTSRLLSAPFTRYINSLPRPKWGIKIFRKRASKSVAAVADLAYNTISKRAEYFKEIYGSSRIIADPYKQYYDDLAALAALGYQIGSVLEYDTLQAEGVIQIPDYMLIEFIVNSTSNGIDTLKLYVGATGLTTYLFNHKTQAWDSFTNTNGLITVTDFRSYLQYDKISVLCYKATAFDITAPYILFKGEEGKEPLSRKTPLRMAGANLLAAPHFNNGTTGWTVTGTLATPAAASDNSMPNDITKVAVISTGVTVRQNITIPVTTGINPPTPKKKAQLIVVARYNPPSYSSASTYPTGSPITEDTFDFAKVRVIITKGANSSYYNELVGLWWEDIRIDLDLQGYDSAISVAVQYVDKDFELASVSLVVEG